MYIRRWVHYRLHREPLTDMHITKVTCMSPGSATNTYVLVVLVDVDVLYMAPPPHVLLV